MKIPKKIKALYRSDGSLKTITTTLYTPKNYRRLFLNQALPLVAHFANKPVQIILFLLNNADSNNMIYATYADIMEACEIKDRSLVSSVLKELLTLEAIVKISTSHYMLNPAITMQGNNQKFGLIASQFDSILNEQKKKGIKKHE